MNRDKFPQKSILPRYLSLITLVLVAVVAMNSIIDAKYVTLKRNDPAAIAQDFYFESDLLKASSTPTYTLPVGTTKIVFMLKNHTDALRYAETDITYEILLDNVIEDTGTIETGDANKVPVELDVNAGTYTVTARAISPYTATLQAQFVIPGRVEYVDHSVNDQTNSPIARLTVWTNDYNGRVRIEWPTGVYPDNTDPMLGGATGSYIDLNLKHDESYTFVFFKSDHSSAYVYDDFSVTTLD